MLEPLLERFRKGDRLALARLLTFAARGEHLDELRALVTSAPRRGRVIAFTGGGGVGKSTLIGKLLEHVRTLGLSVAVLACDPRSPLSGGALLGDRFRMAARADDPDVYIRSLAATADQGPVARHVDLMIALLETFGFNLVFVETVGAGQGDTLFAELADVVVLLVQPETGDDVQWEKAGVLEIADVVVVHKADLPSADHTETQVRAALELSAGRSAVVLRVSSKRGTGVGDLWAAIESVTARRDAAAGAEHEFFRLAQQAFSTWFSKAMSAGQLDDVLRGWSAGRLTREDVVATIAARFGKDATRSLTHSDDA